MKQKVIIVDGEQRYRRPEVKIENLEVITPTASLAAALIEHWGMVAGADGGEDSHGRAKVRLLSPTEVVQRAFDTAELFEAEARKRGHILQLPDLDAMATAKTSDINEQAA